MLVLLTLLLGCGACGPSGSPPATGPATRPPATTADPSGSDREEPVSTPGADRPGRPATGSAAVGINEGVSIPQAFVTSGRITPDQEPAMLVADAAAVVDLGAGAVRANTATYPWLSWWNSRRQGGGWSRADAWIRAVTDAGLEPLVMVGPWPGNRTANYTDRYVPDDLDAYAAWVGRVVERYDGDGIDDMPGLRAPVRAWEVDNEPDLHNSVAPRGGRSRVDPARFETPAEYARVLAVTAAAIRAADPDAVVLSAGFYRPHTDPGRDWIERWLAEPGVRDSFDVLSLHCYFDGDDLDRVARTLATWKATAPDKPLWVTETGVPSAGRKPWISEEWQARMAVAVVGAFLAGGADRVFWHTLADPPPNPASRRSPFASHSLRRTSADGTLVDKPAGTTFRRMMAHLGPTDPRSYQPRDDGDARMLQTDRGWLLYWGTAVAPAGAREAIDLRSGDGRPLSTPIPAPAWFARAASGDAPDGPQGSLLPPL
ncbi:MAG: hypothetical protein D6798_11635 [Deltaproteobacteria bacterium]|nr:MAG: hypothetical protein D6798_11635 [Deltaproteobacteria bacterium]